MDRFPEQPAAVLARNWAHSLYGDSPEPELDFEDAETVNDPETCPTRIYITENSTTLREMWAALRAHASTDCRDCEARERLAAIQRKPAGSQGNQIQEKAKQA